MKKIILSILAIALTIGTVSGTAYALFSDKVTVGGITVQSGSAVLEVSKDHSNWLEGISYNDQSWTEMLYPGYENPNIATFWLRNSSTANIDLAVTGKLTPAAFDANWNALKNVVEIKITNYYAPERPTTDWKSLNQWYQGYELPQELSPVGDDDEYRMEVRMIGTATDTAAGRVLNGMTFTLTGTQIP